MVEISEKIRNYCLYYRLQLELTAVEIFQFNIIDNNSTCQKFSCYHLATFFVSKLKLLNYLQKCQFLMLITSKELQLKLAENRNAKKEFSSLKVELLQFKFNLVEF